MTGRRLPPVWSRSRNPPVRRRSRRSGPDASPLGEGDHQVLALAKRKARAEPVLVREREQRNIVTPRDHAGDFVDMGLAPFRLQPRPGRPFSLAKPLDWEKRRSGYSLRERNHPKPASASATGSGAVSGFHFMRAGSRRTGYYPAMRHRREVRPAALATDGP